jgi:gas vesicle protein
MNITKDDKSKIDSIINDITDKVDSLKSDVKDKVLDNKINEIKEYLSDEISKQLNFIKNDLEDLKERKVPERRQFETEGAYRENLFTIACYVLDEVLPDLFDDLPEYNLIAAQLSRNFEDGTVSDAIVTVNVRIIKEEYQYDFKVDVPILNGIATAPLYLQRGLKVIPLTKDTIDKELASLSFNKIPVNDLTTKENLFNNMGDKNRFKRFDKQKQYQVDEQAMNPIGMPPSPRYTINKSTKLSN